MSTRCTCSLSIGSGKYWGKRILIYWGRCIYVGMRRFWRIFNSSTIDLVTNSTISRICWLLWRFVAIPNRRCDSLVCRLTGCPDLGKKIRTSFQGGSGSGFSHINRLVCLNVGLLLKNIDQGTRILATPTPTPTLEPKPRHLGGAYISWD